MLIYTLPQLYKAVVINRPSKTCKSPYIADIKILEEKTINNKKFLIRSDECMAHSPSLGCAGLISSESKVNCIKLDNEKLTSKYRIFQCEIQDNSNKIVIGTNPNICNTLFENILTNNILSQFNGYTIKREYTIGNSRIDFFLKNDSNDKILIEVKNVCLAYYEDIPLKEIKKKNYSNFDVNSKIAIFPDCNRKIQKKPVSPRAIKHIDELIEASNNGYKCYLVFIIQRTDCNYFSPSKLDKTYYDKLQFAYKNNYLNIIPIQIEWIGCNAYYKKILELDPYFKH